METRGLMEKRWALILPAMEGQRHIYLSMKGL
jgi:hypothetical protein